MADGRPRQPLPGSFGVPYDLIVVASLSAFLGSFLSGFAKDMGAAAGKASAEAVRAAARRLRDHLRRHADPSKDIVVCGQKDGRFLVVENLNALSDRALEELVQMELPDEAGRVTWNGVTARWQFSPDQPMKPPTSPRPRS